MDIIFIAWAFLSSVVVYYLYDNVYVKTSKNNSLNNEEEE